MEPPDYIDLNRAFVPYDANKPEQDLQDIELADQLGSDHRPRWIDLEQSSRVVVLGEARSGKSKELQHQAGRLREAGHLAFTMTVEDLHDHGLKVAMMDMGDDGLTRWRSQGGSAHLLIDSIDEARLTGRRLESALRDIRRTLSADELGRARIILSCRYTDWRTIEDLQSVRDLLDAKEVRVVVLHGLDWKQIQTFVQARASRNADGFIEQLRETGAVAFARRPGDLAWLVDYWNTHTRIGSMSELIEDAVERFLREESPNQPSTLTRHQVRRAVEQLAGTMTIGRWNQIDHPIDGSGVNTEDRLVPTRILSDLPAAQLREVLSSRIFDPATLGRTKFRHRTIREYLAARWLESLSKEGLGDDQLGGLIFTKRENRAIARPSLASVAAWLAPKHEKIAQALLESSPRSLIVDGDPAGVPDELRIRGLLAHAHRYTDRTRLLDSFGGDDLRRFASPALAPTIDDLLSINGAEQLQVLALGLVQHGQLADCRATVSRVAIDETRSADIRSHAIVAMGAIGVHGDQEVVVEHYIRAPRIDEYVLEALIDTFYPNALDGSSLISLIRLFASDRRHLPKCHYWFSFFWTLHRRKEGLPHIVRQLRSLLDERASPTGSIDAHDEFIYRLYDTALAALADLWGTGDETAVLERAIRDAASPWGTRFQHYGHLSRLSERLDKNLELRRTLLERMLSAEDEKAGLAALKRACHLAPCDSPGLIELARSGVSTRLREAALLTLLTHSHIHDLDLGEIRELVRDLPDVARHVDMRLERQASAAESNAETERRREQEAEDQRRGREKFVARLRSTLDELRAGNVIEDLFCIFIEAMQSRMPTPAMIESTLVNEFGSEIASAAMEGFRATWRALDHDCADSDSHDLLREIRWAGLDLDVRDGLDLASLSSDLAQRATSIALSGTHLPPPWLDTLAQAHPDSVRSAIDRFENENWLVGRLCRAPNSVKRLCTDILWTAAERSFHRQAQTLREVLRALFAVGEDHPRLRERCVQVCRDEPRPEHWGAWWALWFRLDPNDAMSCLEDSATDRSDERHEMIAWAAASLWTEPGALPTDAQVLERLWSCFEAHIPKELVSPQSRNTRRINIDAARGRIIDALSNVDILGGLQALQRLAQAFPGKRDWLLDRVDRRLADEAEAQSSPLVARLLDACEHHGLALIEHVGIIFANEEFLEFLPSEDQSFIPRLGIDNRGATIEQMFVIQGNASFVAMNTAIPGAARQPPQPAAASPAEEEVGEVDDK